MKRAYMLHMLQLVVTAGVLSDATKRRRYDAGATLEEIEQVRHFHLFTFSQPRISDSRVRTKPSTLSLLLLSTCCAIRGAGCIESIAVAQCMKNVCLEITVALIAGLLQGGGGMHDGFGGGGMHDEYMFANMFGGRGGYGQGGPYGGNPFGR